MASTYSSIATHMWPPPSSDTASRIQRLQELEQMRKQRQANSVMQINSEPTDATTRLSRRQQIGGHSIGMRKLVDGHEERRKTLLGRRALNENRSSEMNNSLSMSQGSIDSSTYHGGARPKNFDISSVRKIALSHPGEVIGRERSSSLTNSETSSNVPLLRSQSITGLPDQSESCDNVEQIYDKENFPTKEIETVTNTSISEDEEDIESFKRSLLGIQSFTPVSEKDEPVLQQRLPTLRRHENEIDTSKLIIHRTDRKEKTFSMPITETTSGRSSQGRIQNLVTDSMKRLDSLFETPKLSSTKSETLPRNYRFSPTTERVSHRSKITEVKSLRERIKDRKDVTSKVQEQQDQINSHQLRNSNQQENNTFRPPITSDAIEIVENQIENEVEGKVYTKVNNGIQITGSFTSLQLSQSGTVNESFQNQVRSPVPNNMNSLQDDVTTEPDDKPHDIAKCENEVTDEQTVQSSIISDNKACLETSAYENGQEDDNELPVGSKTTTYTHITEIISDHSQLNNSLEQTGQQEIKDENMNETNNSYVYFMKKEQEDDLVDASNVEFFETNDVYSNFDGNTENENTSNFSQFSNTNDFLNYDQSVRNESEVNEKSLYGVNTDILPSRSFRSMSVDHRSGFGSHPYSRREQSMFHSYSGQEGVGKVSLGVSGISQDALSRINDLFGQKTETRTSDIVSSLPRKRARDTLVGSRTAISRSRSDVGEDTKFESRRTSLINRTNLDSQSDKGSNNQLGSYTDRQPSYISSFLTEEDIQSRREQNANHIEEIRNRIRMHTKGDYQSSSKVVNNFSLGENRFNSLPYMRSRSLDHDGENNTESVTFQNYDVNFSAENSDELISKINKLTSEISSEFFSNEDSQLEDSNNTLTPETEIEEILLEPNEMNKTEMPGDEELTFNTSCEVEVGEVLVCKTSEDYREETNVGDKNNSVESDDSKLPIAENDGKNSEIENLAKTEKLDSTVNEETKNDGEKNSLENLDETDNKSIASTTSSTSSSSKKKKNKKKGKKESNPPKVIVSHPSEILAKDKKAKKETKTKITSSVVGNGTKKEEKSIKKGKFFSKESKTEKVVQSKDKNEKTSSKPSAQTEKGKKEEPTSPNKDKNKHPENNTDSPKSQSKLKNLFDSLIHALDHKSETSSVTTLSVEDARSGSSGEKTPIADEWEIITEPAASDLNIIHEDNYATFTDEEIPEVKQRLDENGGMSTDNYETASDHTISGGSEYEEFYEALPTELLGNAWKESAYQNETERKEQFVYVCAGSKVRRKRNPVQNIDGSNTDIINQWIANNLYPGDKYPEKGDKIANFKFTESSENDNTKEKFESSILRQLKKTEFNANQSRNVSNDHEKTCIPNKDSVETELKSSNKTIGSVHVANKRAVSHQNSSEFQLSPDITAVDKEVPQAITVVDKEEQLSKLKYSGTTECLSSQGIKEENNEPNIELVKSKSLENVHIKASDSSFTDTFITKLRDKLCTCCQGVLLDVLKETYFTRYEEISKINLTKLVNLTKPEHKEDQKICDNKLESSENIRLEDLKKHHKAKKLVVEDLLYEKSDESDSKPVSAVQNGKDEKMETDEQLNCNNTQEVESKETVQEKFKAPSLKLKDKLITPPKSDKTSPRKYSGEIKKGKTISIDKSNNKKEEKVSPKSEPRLCRQSSKTGDQESRRSDINKTINKENDKSKSDSEKGENDEEYKLPKLDENPFIKSDKLRTSFKKVDQSKKAESTVKTTVIKRSTNGTNDSSKPSSPQKSSPPFARGTNGSRKSDISVTDKTKTANGMEAVRPESFTNGNTVKSVETEKDKKLGSPKKTSPNGSKKPSMFDHLNFAKSVCETLGPKETNTNIDNKTDNLVKSHEHFESETVLKKTKTLPKKKRFSPFGGKRK